MLEEVRTPDQDASVEPGAPPEGAFVPGEPDFEVTCGRCRRVVRVPGHQLGRFVTCRECGGRFLARLDPATVGAGAPRPPGPGQPEKLEARIRREFRLDRSASRPPDDAPTARGDSPGPGVGGDQSRAEIARVRADLEELRPRVAGLEARTSAAPGSEALTPAPGERTGRIGGLEGEIDRVRGELDRVRGELESTAIGHQEALDRLERARIEAEARRAEDREALSGAIEHAIREGRAAAEVGLEASRAQLEFDRARSASEVEKLVDRVDRALRSAEELREDRDAALARSGDLERRGRELEERLAALEQRVDPEASRLLDAAVDGLARDLEQARGLEEATRREVASLIGRVEELEAALDARLDRLSEELGAARGLEDRVAARVASLEARVDGLLGEAERRAELERSGREGEVAALRGEVAGWAARLAAVGPATDGLRALEAEVARLSAGLEALRSGAAPAPRDVAPATVPTVPGERAPTVPGPAASPEVPRAPAAAGRPALAPAPAEPAREPSIVLQGVGKEYRRDSFRVPVLEGLDLSVDRGEFLALMGPSGSGKTTLLNLIAGLDRATSGSVVVHGRELAGLSEAGLTRWRANNVGFVFQMYNLIPVMTALRNVELPLLLTRLSGRQRRENARTALRIVGLEGREDHYPRQLSGGQEQRVSIARAIVTDPHLIVADEPTGDLDRQSAGEILDLLESLNREFGKTIVMVTHDPLAARRATRVLHLDKGRLVADTPQPRARVGPSKGPVPAGQPRSPGRSA